MSYLDLLREKNAEKGLKKNCTKCANGFSQFTQSPDEAKKLDSLTSTTKSGLALDEEVALLAWLIDDGDSPEGIVEVLDCCRRDPQAHDYFLNIAEQAQAKQRQQ